MAEQSDSRDDKLARLKLAYAEKLPQKVEDIADSWARLLKEWKPDEAEELYRSVHSLCGSSGSYGAAGVNKHARSLEKIILTVIYDNREPTGPEVSEFGLLMGRTQKAAKNWSTRLAHADNPSDARTAHLDSDPPVFILDNDEHFSALLIQALANKPYTTRQFSVRDEFIRACKKEKPALIIMDPATATGEGPGADALDNVHKLIGELPPVIFVSSRNDIRSRLESVRAGAVRYFEKPLSNELLIKVIDEYLLHQPDDPYRVLIIDDDESVSKLHAQNLVEAGIETRLLAEPLSAIEEIADSRPDLILMDVHMPGCSGPELAAVIRQDVQFADIPILFLSADTNIGKYLQALGLAGEEYLEKPVDVKWLVQSILARVKKRRAWVSRIETYASAVNESQIKEFALNEHAIVSYADASGRITYVNHKFCEVSGYSRDELVGQDHNIVNSGYHPHEFFEQMWETITNGDVWHGEICNVRKDGRIYWVASTIVPFLDHHGLPYQYVSIRTDVTKLKALELDVSHHAELLDSLHAAMTGFMSAGQFNNVISMLLDSVISLTGSDYGVMAEVLFEEDRHCLVPHAIRSSGLGYQADSDHARDRHQVRKLDGDLGLLDAICRRGEVVVSDNIMRDALGIGLPGGDSRLRKFLGLPVFNGNQLVGIVALARYDEGFSPDIVSFLEALNSTYGVMIRAKRIAEMEGEVNFFLDQARNEAELANKAKSEFLSSMSHELRTPLNVILGFAQIMVSDSEHELSESQKENAEEILHAGRHLLDLVNQILDLSRIEAGELDLNFESIAMESLIGDCIGMVSALAKAKNIEIEYARDLFRGKRVRADVTRVNQAIINYLSNAVKYTPEHGKVLVECSQSRDSVLRISVSDTGPGIPEQKQELLFTPFNRLGAEDSEEEGTGIGLVITKNLIERMGGMVGYERNDSGGSCFWLELPIDIPFPVTGQVTNTNKPISTAGIASKPGIKDSHRILYIEDNLANLNLVRQLIGRRENLELITAEDPESGLRLIESNKLDVLLLDINLPVMSGYEVLARVRENERTRNLPVIAVSANAMPADIQLGKEAGFDDYITKPIQLDQFFRVLDRVIVNAKK